MKRLIIFLAVLFFFLCPSLGFSDYYIHLKNGRGFQTSQYWEKDGQIFFYRSGQTFGVDKKSVERIETVPASLINNSSVKPLEQPAPPVEQKAETSPEIHIPSKDDNPENQIILKEFSQIQNRFQLVDRLSTQELHAFDQDLTAFRDNILANRLGHIYDKQLLEINEMGSKIETLLKARSQ
ncbi:MAG: hypothetical protein WA151_13455 [Desulfatirhabdiaceae bacterium]